MDDIFKQYSIDFRYVSNFVDTNFETLASFVQLRRSPPDTIKACLKGSNLRDMHFHGLGCEFYFKGRSIDTDFSEDKLGFTDWSLYVYAKEYDASITWDDAKKFLQALTQKGVTYQDGRVYFLSSIINDDNQS